MPVVGVNMSLQVGGVEVNADQVGEVAGNQRAGVLEGHVDAAAEGLRNGDDGPHQRDREPRRAQQSRPAEEQNEAGGVDHGDQRQRRQLQQPVLIDGDDEQGLVADKDQQHGGGEQNEAPPGAIGLPAEFAPVAQQQGEADERHGHANGLEGVALPDAKERLDGSADGKQANSGGRAGQRGRGSGGEGEGQGAKRQLRQAARAGGLRLHSRGLSGESKENKATAS